jgi:hypothetical protein
MVQSMQTKSRKFVQRGGLVVAALAALSLAACSSSVREVRVSLDASLVESGQAKQPIEVDVIGVNTLDGGVQYGPENLDEYFARDSALRANAPRHTFRFDPQTGGVSQSLKRGEGPWKRWTGSKADRLVVLLTGLPSKSQRFLAVPFDTERWPDGTAKFVVRDTGVVAGAAGTSD